MNKLLAFINYISLILALPIYVAANSTIPEHNNLVSIIDNSSNLSWLDISQFKGWNDISIPNLSFSQADSSMVAINASNSFHNQSSVYMAFLDTVNNQTTLNLQTTGQGTDDQMIINLQENEVPLAQNAFREGAEQNIQIIRLSSPDDFSHPSIGKLLRNKANIFFFSSTKSMIYNQAGKWMELRLTEREIKTEASDTIIPVSSCFYSSEELKSHFLRAYATTVYIGGGISLSLGGKLRNIVGLSASLGSQATTGNVYSGVIQCDIVPGKYMQMFIQPFMSKIPEMEEQEVEFVGRSLRMKRLVDKVHKLQKIKLLTQTLPNHLCKVANDPNELMCHGSKNKWEIQNINHVGRVEN